jgi:hypothetical protein
MPPAVGAKDRIVGTGGRGVPLLELLDEVELDEDAPVVGVPVLFEDVHEPVPVPLEVVDIEDALLAVVLAVELAAPEAMLTVPEVDGVPLVAKVDPDDEALDDEARVDPAPDELPAIVALDVELAADPEELDVTEPPRGWQTPATHR